MGVVILCTDMYVVIRIPIRYSFGLKMWWIDFKFAYGGRQDGLAPWAPVGRAEKEQLRVRTKKKFFQPPIFTSWGLGGVFSRCYSLLPNDRPQLKKSKK